MSAATQDQGPATLEERPTRPSSRRAIRSRRVRGFDGSDDAAPQSAHLAKHPVSTRNGALGVDGRRGSPCSSSASMTIPSWRGAEQATTTAASHGQAAASSAPTTASAPDLSVLAPIVDTAPTPAAVQAKPAKAKVRARRPLAPVISGLAANGIPNVARSTRTGLPPHAWTTPTRAAASTGRCWPASAARSPTTGSSPAPCCTPTARQPRRIIGIGRSTDTAPNWSDDIPTTADGVELDGDTVYCPGRSARCEDSSRLRGPSYGVDANGDGIADIRSSINDAALTAARYLCAAGGNDLRTPRRSGRRGTDVQPQRPVPGAGAWRWPTRTTAASRSPACRTATPPAALPPVDVAGPQPERPAGRGPAGWPHGRGQDDARNKSTSKHDAQGEQPEDHGKDRTQDEHRRPGLAVQPPWPTPPKSGRRRHRPHPVRARRRAVRVQPSGDTEPDQAVHHLGRAEPSPVVLAIGIICQRFVR